MEQEIRGNGHSDAKPGRVVLFGSGEISPSGRKVHARVFETLAQPIRVAILETPAGFQPNSHAVAQEVADFIQHHLPNFDPQVTVVPARKKGTDGCSPDDPHIVAPILESNYIFLGPGSPTYTVRNLQDTLAWRYILAAQRHGAVLSLASAACIAVGVHALPVYEIYKAGDDLHWTEGLNLFGRYGLELTIVPHWNNADGGEKLDTSCCYMGQERMRQLVEMLPGTVTLLGLDEHTAVIFDFDALTCEVIGKDTITIRSRGNVRVFRAGVTFSMGVLGDVQLPALLGEELPKGAVDALADTELTLPVEVRMLIEEREKARGAHRWEKADRLRERVADMGYEIQDTPTGPRWRPAGGQAEWHEFGPKNPDE